MLVVIVTIVCLFCLFSMENTWESAAKNLSITKPLLFKTSLSILLIPGLVSMLYPQQLIIVSLQLVDRLCAKCRFAENANKVCVDTVLEHPTVEHCLYKHKFCLHELMYTIFFWLVRKCPSNFNLSTRDVSCIINNKKWYII